MTWQIEKRSRAEALLEFMKSNRSRCPISCVLDLLGDQWTLLVIRDLMLGRTQFKEFTDSSEGIATNILTDRLSRLVEYGVIETFPSEPTGKHAYRLTKKGKSLEPVVKAVADWGLQNIKGTKIGMKPK